MPFDTAGSVESDLEILRKVRKSIAYSGWIQGEFHDGHGNRCVVGWIAFHTLGGRDGGVIPQSVLDLIHRNFPISSALRETSATILVGFNDDPATRREDILARVDLAIRVAEARRA